MAHKKKCVPNLSNRVAACISGREQLAPATRGCHVGFPCSHHSHCHSHMYLPAHGICTCTWDLCCCAQPTREMRQAQGNGLGVVKPLVVHICYHGLCYCG